MAEIANLQIVSEDTGKKNDNALDQNNTEGLLMIRHTHTRYVYYNFPPNICALVNNYTHSFAYQ